MGDLITGLIKNNPDEYLTGFVVFMTFLLVSKVLGHRDEIPSVALAIAPTILLAIMAFCLFFTIQSKYLAFVNYVISIFAFIIVIKLLGDYNFDNVWWKD